MNNKKEFKKELKALLTKYNASIRFTCSPGSDTHGLYDDHIAIYIGDSPVINADGWRLNAKDITIK